MRVCVEQFSDGQHVHENKLKAATLCKSIKKNQPSVSFTHKLGPYIQYKVAGNVMFTYNFIIITIGDDCFCFSHCIFNIKILRVVDKESPHVARVSM